MNEHYKFANTPLPYGYGALEPYIDEKTMYLHHDKHLQGYIDNLNKVLRDYPAYQSWSLEKLLVESKLLPTDIKIAVERNAGGVYNHFFFFDAMGRRNNVPSSEMLKLINKFFGSFKDFAQKFADAATGVFGSGYAWLVLNKNYELAVTTSANQDTPLTDNLYPLLNIDVWEHAYYLKYNNLRKDYVQNYFEIINWGRVEERLHGIFSGFHKNVTIK